MKVFEKNPSRMCSTANFIAAIALIIIFSSALPVKSDAFAIINDNAVQKKVGSTVSQRLYTRSITKVRDSDWSYTQLNAQVDNKSNHAAVIVSNLRGGGGDGPNSMSLAKKISAYASKNFFLLGMIAAVSFAKLFPELGKNGSILRPELFIGKYGVTTIFLLSGISLKLKELTNAMSNVKLNALIQIISFGAWPFLVGLPMTKCLENFLPGLLPTPLVEGLLILTCLPTTINMCIILTSAAGGNVASALCNAVISNIAGIFLTPALLLQFFGKSIELPFFDLVKKLCNKVLLPVAVGQFLRGTPAKEFYSEHTGFFKRFQEIVLLGIVWNAFSNAFTSGLGMEFRHTAVLMILLPLLHTASLASIFSFFRSGFFGFSTEEAIAATFCSAHKTLAFGLPLINTIFDGNPNLASYCAPLMIMHPLQLVIGSLVTPYFSSLANQSGNMNDSGS